MLNNIHEISDSIKDQGLKERIMYYKKNKIPPVILLLH